MKSLHKNSYFNLLRFAISVIFVIKNLIFEFICSLRILKDGPELGMQTLSYN